MEVAEVVEETEPIIILDPEQEELGKKQNKLNLRWKILKSHFGILRS